MPLVQAKCTNCAGNLQVDNTKDAAICPYCGTPYIVEKAIQCFNGINISNPGTVNIYGNGNPDFEIVAGVLKSYKGASPQVVIPDSVTSIKCCFSEGVTSVYIPDSVVDISRGAFWGCKTLNSIRWPKTFANQPIRKLNSCLPANYPIRVISESQTNVDFLVYRLYNTDTPYFTDLLETNIYCRYLSSSHSPYEISHISKSISFSFNDHFREEINRAACLSDIGTQPVKEVEVPLFVMKTKAITKKPYIVQNGMTKALQMTLPFINPADDLK